MRLKNAFRYYQKHIAPSCLQKREIYQMYNFPTAGLVPFRDWEVFCAILMQTKARKGNGSDLPLHEVKSAKKGNSFEYQYHRHSGLTKLKHDQSIDHLFVVYQDDTYQDIDVYMMPSQDMFSIIASWEPKVIESYSAANPKQRCRESISYTTVVEKGIKLVTIRKGMMV